LYWDYVPICPVCNGIIELKLCMGICFVRNTPYAMDRMKWISAEAAMERRPCTNADKG